MIHLTASSEVRRQRIALKEGEAKQADIRELDWEDKKQRAREFLLENSGIVVLDTTFLNDQEERTRFVCFIKENVKNVTINAHVFPANLAISLQRDSMRENIRRVGFEVINNLASQYIEPILQEGFDNVFVIDSANI